MAKKLRKIGVCRICGISDVLTEEHILPRAAGGGKTVKVYTGTELLKTLESPGEESPFGQIKQSGHAEYTLCRPCNSRSGSDYDKDFSVFYNAIGYGIASLVKDIELVNGQTLDDHLADMQVTLKLRGVKPMNIAKRVLVSFCSIEHPGLTERKPEIRKAIIDKHYKPKVDDFSIYLTPHVGGSNYYATMASLSGLLTGKTVTQAFAGMELGPTAFYLSGHDEHLKGGNLNKCLNITHWLTDYDYDQKVDMTIVAGFRKPLMMNFPVPEWK